MNAKPFNTIISGLDVDAFLRYVQDPRRVEEVFRIQESFKESPLKEEMVSHMLLAARSNESFMDLFAKRYMPVFPLLSQLLDMPAGSLGRALGEYLQKNNIKLDFAGLDTSAYYKSEMNEVTFLGQRALRNHDAYHVLLGFGASAMDECALAAVQLSQFASPLYSTLVASWILHFIFVNPQGMGEVLEVTARNYQLGKKLIFLPGFPIEEHWNKPLVEVQALVGLH